MRSCAASQIIAVPLYQAFAAVFPACAPMLESVKENYRHWQSVEGGGGAGPAGAAAAPLDRAAGLGPPA